MKCSRSSTRSSSLGGRANDFGLDTPLLGALPELDSMAVVGLINMIEERFGFVD